MVPLEPIGFFRNHMGENFFGKLHFFPLWGFASSGEQFGS